jgi:hypothetical protein
MAAVTDPYKPYKAKDTSAALPEYDAMRKRLTQRVQADTQQQQDALARRFASMGASNSGAAIKQQQMAAESGVRQREEGLEGIQSQESAERRRLAEIESGREFQSQEAVAGRQFQAGESRLGREFTAGESALGRQFAAGESRLGREFTAGEAEKTRGFTAGEADKGRAFTAGESALGRQFAAAESKLARDQSQSQFLSSQRFQDKWNRAANEISMRQLDLAFDESEFNKDSALAQMSPEERSQIMMTSGMRKAGNDPAKMSQVIEAQAQEIMRRLRG